MQINLQSNQLRKFILTNADTVIGYPNNSLPQYLVFAGQNLFAYPKSNSSSVLLQITYRNHTKELLTVLVDDKPLASNVEQEPPNALGSTNLIFTDSEPIYFDNILSKMVYSKSPLTFRLINQQTGVKLNGDSVFGIPVANKGELKINATDSFNQSVIFDIPYQRMDQLVPNQWLIFFAFFFVVGLYSFITAYLMRMPHHKINLTVCESRTKNTKTHSSTIETDSGYELQKSEEEFGSNKATKSIMPSSITKSPDLEDLLNRHSIDVDDTSNDPIKLETLKIAPMSKYESFMGIQLNSLEITASLVNGEDLPKWMTLDKPSSLMMLHPTMDDLGTFIVIIRRNRMAIKILQITVEYSTYDEPPSMPSDLSVSDFL